METDPKPHGKKARSVTPQPLELNILQRWEKSRQEEN